MSGTTCDHASEPSEFLPVRSGVTRKWSPLSSSEQRSNCLGNAPDLDHPLVPDSVEVLVVRDENRTLLEACGRVKHIRRVGSAKVPRTHAEVVLSHSNEPSSVHQDRNEPSGGLRT